jgi:hypothetical protein
VPKPDIRAQVFWFFTAEKRSFVPRITSRMVEGMLVRMARTQVLTASRDDSFPPETAVGTSSRL